LWLCRNYEHYFVALDETKFYLESLGFDAEKTSVCGIPIDPVFSEEKSRDAMREKFGLEQDTPVLILSLGGFGVGRIDGLLDSLRSIRQPVQILAMCGRNEELKKRLEMETGPADGARIIPVGYTKEMDEYMSAADLIVGKPGGLTTCEALAKGLGFVVVNPIPGQEERNADHLLENGAAIRSNNPVTLGYKIQHLLKDPEKLERMRSNAIAFSRPRAAFEIADKLAELSRA